jgi:hypothetical protein
MRRRMANGSNRRAPALRLSWRKRTPSSEQAGMCISRTPTGGDTDRQGSMTFYRSTGNRRSRFNLPPSKTGPIGSAALRTGSRSRTASSRDGARHGFLLVTNTVLIYVDSSKQVGDKTNQLGIRHDVAPRPPVSHSETVRLVALRFLRGRQEAVPVLLASPVPRPLL